MNWAHVHLLINHIPVLGTLFGALLLVFGIVKKNEEIKRVSLGILGIFAIGTLWRYRRVDTIPNRFVIAGLILSIIVFGLMAWTADLGGKIRHSEIRSESNAAALIKEAEESNHH